MLTLLACSPLCWQPLRGQSPGVGVKSGSDRKQATELTAPKAQTDQRGTKDSPLTVDVLSRPKSQQEAAEEKRKLDDRESRDRWTFNLAIAVAGFTGLLVIVGWRGVRVANRTLRAIEAQTGATRDSVALLANAERAWVN
jgi:hypothetical protein